MSEKAEEKGPIIGVPLIKELPIASGVMHTLPTHDELEQAKFFNGALVCSYEVVLLNYRRVSGELAKVSPAVASIAQADSDLLTASFGRQNSVDLFGNILLYHRREGKFVAWIRLVRDRYLVIDMTVRGVVGHGPCLKVTVQEYPNDEVFVKTVLTTYLRADWAVARCDVPELIDSNGELVTPMPD